MLEIYRFESPVPLRSLVSLAGALAADARDPFEIY